MNDEPQPLGWWTISGEALLDMLRSAHDGQDPDLLYAEEYANSDREYPNSDDPERGDDLRDLLHDVRAFLADLSSDYSEDHSAFTCALFRRFDQRIRDAVGPRR